MNKKDKPSIHRRKAVRSRSADCRWQPEVAQAAPVKKNPIHSLVTTLPVIMLLVGLWFYYSGEKKQRGGEPVMTELITVSGIYTGSSEQNSNPGAQRLLWIKTADRLRGGRLDLAQFKALEVLEKESDIRVWLAPRIAGSATLWVLKVVADEKVIIDTPELALYK